MKRLLMCAILTACGFAVLAGEPPPKVNGAPAAPTRDERFAARGQIDLYVASTAAIDPKLKKDDERLWLPALKIGKKIVAVTDTSGDRQPKGPTAAKDFAAYRAFWKPVIFREEEVLLTGAKNGTGEPVEGYTQLIQAGKVEARKGLSGLVIARGPVSVKVNLSSALILATGDITTDRGFGQSVIVCDGDVTAERGLACSVVIARGNITIKGGTVSCTLIAGGKVTAKIPEPLLGEDPKEVFAHRVEIKENEPNPLGFITFFELATVGLEVKAANGAVQVAKITAGSACAKAGVKVGDTIVDVGGKKPKDAESLRRLLRDALAIGDAAVKIQRDKELVIVKVSLPE